MTQTFILFSNIQPVRGSKRSSLCDLQRGRIKLIPNSLCDILLQFQNQPLTTILAAHQPEDHSRIEDYFRFLSDNEWGFWCDDPSLFPELSLSFDPPAHITNALIDVVEGYNHDFASIRDQLDHLGCRSLQIRVFSPVEMNWLELVLDILATSRLRNIEILLPFNALWDEETLLQLIRNHPRLFRLVLHGANQAGVKASGTHKTMGLLVKVETAIDSSSHCGQVDRSYFISELYTFAESKQFNSCLNRKIAIDQQGYIRNCPSMDQHWGKLEDKGLGEVASDPDFQKIWAVNKDQIAVCKDCEFRYVCTDCRAYTRDGDPLGKPEKCGYDPYTAQWHDWRVPVCIPV